MNKKDETNTVTDEVINDNIIYEDYGNIFLDDFVDCWPREASRGVIQFSDGDILVFFKERICQYKLPGGGKENDETPEQTFMREAYEETSYMIKNIRKIGVVKDQTQISHIFIAEPYGEAQEIHPDEDEIKFDAKCLKMNPVDVLKNMKKFIIEHKGDSDESSLIQSYFTQRDCKILEYVLDHNLLA